MIAVRFLLVYLLTAVLDYGAFFAVHAWTGSILQSQIAGRLASIPFNYFAVRSAVFQSKVRHESSGPKFLLLYGVAFFAAWALIVWMSGWLPFANEKVRLLAAKMIAEGGILAVKFFVQRRFIFAAPRTVESLQSEAG
jgi:putative flippase GtrA